MKRKLTFGIVTLGSLLAVLPLFSAFEAHVINVVAQIENALYVHPESRNFGTVFPQEYREMGIFVTFSESFSASDQTRVSKVDYDIKQKPKPRPLFEEDIGVEAARLWCHDNYPIAEYDGNAPEWQEYLTKCYPLLCPYLSKTPANLDKNDVGVPPFHNPFATSSVAHGKINKNGAHVGDNWVIDLAVPCFTGQCAQDWADFVHAHNPIADPKLYTLPNELEHEIFGCDLWIEVTKIY